MKNWGEVLKEFLFQTKTNSLESKIYPKEWSELTLGVSFGKGVLAHIPWIAFLQKEVKVNNGIYPVYLYFKKESTLILAYGISETNKPSKTWSKKIISSTSTILEHFRNKVSRYGNSYVYKSYKITFTNNDVSLKSSEDNKKVSMDKLESDLEALLNEYKKPTDPVVKLFLEKSTRKGNLQSQLKHHPTHKIPPSVNKQSFIESCLVNELNKNNYKLKVKSVEYIILNKEFENIYAHMQAGLIAEERIIYSKHIKRFKEKGYQITNKSGRIFARKILAYVWLSKYDKKNGDKEVSRTAFIAQDIFPDITDYMKLYLSSPSFSILNHPIYYINIIGKATSAPFCVRSLAIIIAAGFKYVEIFEQSIIPKDVPKNIEGFIKKYQDKETKQIPNGYKSTRYEANFIAKTLTIKAPLIILDKKKYTTEEIKKSDITVKTNGEYDFKGSKERYYLLEVLSLAIIAANSNYAIDFSDYEKFIRINMPKFSSTSDKKKRFETLLEYLKKLQHKKHYHEL